MLVIYMIRLYKHNKLLVVMNVTSKYLGPVIWNTVPLQLKQRKSLMASKILLGIGNLTIVPAGYVETTYQI